MSDEAFIRAIQAKPLDVAYRLVYADYLDEQDDPRGAFLRCTCELDTPNRPMADVIRTHQQLDVLEPRIDATWVTQVMANRVWLRYHRHTFALLDETPVLDPQSLKLIAKWEKKHKRKLPAAVREWYSLAGVDERLGTDEAAFEPELIEESLRVRRGPQPTQLYFGLWVDYGLGFHVPISEEDDPRLQADEEFGSLQMRSFSESTFQLTWSKLMALADFGFENPNYIRPTTPNEDVPFLHITKTTIGPRDLRQLQASFVEHGSHYVAGKAHKQHNPFTGADIDRWGPASELRFYAPGVAIKVTCKGDPRKRAKECYWEIASRSEKTLFDVVATYLWEHSDLSANMTSPTKSGKKVLKRLQELG